MARSYHIKKDGTPGICKAQQGNCPLGREEEHFSSLESAGKFADSYFEKIVYIKNRLETFGLEEEKMKNILDRIENEFSKNNIINSDIESGIDQVCSDYSKMPFEIFARTDINELLNSELDGYKNIFQRNNKEKIDEYRQEVLNIKKEEKVNLDSCLDNGEYFEFYCDNSEWDNEIGDAIKELLDEYKISKKDKEKLDTMVENYLLNDFKDITPEDYSLVMFPVDRFLNKKVKPAKKKYAFTHDEVYTKLFNKDFCNTLAHNFEITDQKEAFSTVKKCFNKRYNKALKMLEKDYEFTEVDFEEVKAAIKDLELQKGRRKPQNEAEEISINFKRYFNPEKYYRFNKAMEKSSSDYYKTKDKYFEDTDKGIYKYIESSPTIKLNKDGKDIKTKLVFIPKDLL